MKANFLTGLALILPITLTVLIFGWMINLLTNPFQGVIQSILLYYDILNAPLFFLSASQVLFYSSKLIVLIILACLLVIVGFVGQLLIASTLFSFADYIISYIPLVNTIYKKIQEVVKTFFSTKGSAFSDVVMVPFPSNQTYTLGLISNEQSKLSANNVVSVFVPGAPNPTFGFMLSCKQEEIIYLDMKVEEAIKFVVSCGIMPPNFKRKSKPST